eukprot:CAMPEP_0170297574 /NCGR_PEP_ID=MMETSP0116_2-20130129/48948_1 /TAXON_ID=400756 /ORGANISM="Durinskia baltica, Strain CSIRO CS-38" /LENGTH=216 /DNA_ID=CAMNT_0010549199 /DNA_START=46 /DNA_END=693 /DNA_ORIENTATION=+
MGPAMLSVLVFAVSAAVLVTSTAVPASSFTAALMRVEADSALSIWDVRIKECATCLKAQSVTKAMFQAEVINNGYASELLDEECKLGCFSVRMYIDDCFEKLHENVGLNMKRLVHRTRARLTKSCGKPRCVTCLQGKGFSQADIEELRQTKHRAIKPVKDACGKECGRDVKHVEKTLQRVHDYRRESRIVGLRHLLRAAGALRAPDRASHPGPTSR